MTTKKGIRHFRCDDCSANCVVTRQSEGIPVFCPNRAYSDYKKNKCLWKEIKVDDKK
jgi:hypothetical protein